VLLGYIIQKVPCGNYKFRCALRTTSNVVIYIAVAPSPLQARLHSQCLQGPGWAKTLVPARALREPWRTRTHMNIRIWELNRPNRWQWNYSNSASSCQWLGVRWRWGGEDDWEPIHSLHQHITLQSSELKTSYTIFLSTRDTDICRDLHFRFIFFYSAV